MSSVSGSFSCLDRKNSNAMAIRATQADLKSPSCCRRAAHGARSARSCSALIFCAYGPAPTYGTMLSGTTGGLSEDISKVWQE